MHAAFNFHLPTRIEFGNGLLDKTGGYLREIALGTRALVITDPGVTRVGIAGRVVDSLKRAGFETAAFSSIEPNPKDLQCEEGAKFARGFSTDIIVAVGGGSVIDAAKVIALLNTHPGRVKDYEGRGKVTQGVTPLVAVPTTAGTGSEVTRSAVITDTERRFKMTVKDLLLAPRLALVDPETTLGLPAEITASTGMDALVHAIEAYTCREANPMADTFALKAMELISGSLRRAVKVGGDLEARHDMMLGSLLAGIAFSHSDVAAVHCLAEALGGLYDTPHGVANSMFLPTVTRFNAEADPARHAQVAAACGLDVAGLAEEAAARFLVEELMALSEDIGIPKLGDLPYLRHEDLEALAHASYINGSTPSNCRALGRADYLDLLRDGLSSS